MICSLVELNEMHRAFWAIQAPLAEIRMKDELLRKIASDRIREGILRGTPIGNQSTIEFELQKADEEKRKVLQNVRSKLGQRGGKAKKKSPLQALIETYVEQHPKCTLKTLERHIRTQVDMGVIDSFTDGLIEFANHDNKVKTVSRSALKHRLTRARKSLRNS